MNAKYTRVRLDLEAARSWLDGSDDVDQQLGQVLDHIIETVLSVEHLAGSKQSNVLRFPSQHR